MKVYPIAVNPIESDLIFIISIYFLLGHLWRRRSFLVSVWSTSMICTPMKKCWRIGRTNWRITSGIPGFCKKHWDWSDFKWINPGDDVLILFSPWLIHRDWGIYWDYVCFLIGPGSAQGFACQDLASYHHRFPIWLLAWCAIVAPLFFSFFLLGVVGMRHVPYEQSTWDTFSIRVLSQNWMKGRFRENPHVSYERRFLATVPQTQPNLDRLWPNTLLYNCVSCVHVV